MKVQLDVDTYRTKFLGGTRQYLFLALFQFPDDETYNSTPGNATSALDFLSPFGYNAGMNVFPYLVKSTSIPEATIEEIQIPYPGRTYKMAGQKSYGDWTISFNVDEKAEVLNKFTSWQNNIYDAESNMASSPIDYMLDQQLFLLNGNGESTKTRSLFDAWPKSIGSVALDYSSADIATVDITFSYQYYTMSSGKAQQPSQQLMSSLLNKLTGSALFNK